MSMQDHDVVGIGNAIVDIIGQCDDAFLSRHGRTKGSMELVDAITVANLYDAMGPGIEISGGSAANTMVGVASFGGRAGFIAKTADDEFGKVFRHDIRAAGVTFNTAAAAGGGDPTGRSLILVTPDGQRTMNTMLGVSPQLGAEEVDADLIRSGRILYLEGYLFDRPQAKAAFRQAADIAAKAGRQVAHERCPIRSASTDTGPSSSDSCAHSVDILFANEAEIASLYEANSFEDAARRAQSGDKARRDHAIGEGQRDPERGPHNRGGSGARRQGGGHDGSRRPLCRRFSVRRSHRHATWKPPAGSAAWRRRR